MKICFIGLDGSGKTTQSQKVCDFLIQSGYDVKYRHQFRYESKKVTFLKDWLRPIIKRTQYLFCTPSSVLITSPTLKVLRSNVIWRLVRLILAYPLGLLVLFSGLMSSRKKNKLYGNHEYFVMDRCFLDEVVRVEWKLGIKVPFKNIWYKFAPAPDITFYFDISAELAWQRMIPQDAGLDAMMRKQEVYLDLIPSFEKYTSLIMVKTEDMNVEEVTNLVLYFLKEQHVVA